MSVYSNSSANVTSFPKKTNNFCSSYPLIIVIKGKLDHPRTRSHHENEKEREKSSIQGAMCKTYTITTVNDTGAETNVYDCTSINPLSLTSLSWPWPDIGRHEVCLYWSAYLILLLADDWDEEECLTIFFPAAPPVLALTEFCLAFLSECFILNFCCSLCALASRITIPVFRTTIVIAGMKKYSVIQIFSLLLKGSA